MFLHQAKAVLKLKGVKATLHHVQIQYVREISYLTVVSTSATVNFGPLVLLMLRLCCSIFN
jgi:hypothetical protein